MSSKKQGRRKHRRLPALVELALRYCVHGKNIEDISIKRRLLLLYASPWQGKDAIAFIERTSQTLGGFVGRTA